MNRLNLFAAIALTTIAAATIPTAQAETYSCYCEGYCGNGGVGANPDTLMSSMDSSTLEDYFALTASGHSSQTGWTCMTESANYSCDASTGAVVTAGDALKSLGEDALTCAQTDADLSAGAPPVSEEPPADDEPAAARPGGGRPHRPGRPPVRR